MRFFSSSVDNFSSTFSKSILDPKLSPINEQNTMSSTSACFIIFYTFSEERL
uniref:Uncharacterized protein n=1 Tax=Lepeophtheirus salmonis TaxID=72036 RepID=A0A0K2TB02_LEPSM